MECGGKRSATPPWYLIRLAKLEGGVALRLPPHSILVPGAPTAILFAPDDGFAILKA